MCVKLGMAAGIDGARIMKVTRLRTERGEWNGVGKLEEASGGSQRRTRRKDQKSVFGGVVKMVRGGVIGSKDVFVFGRRIAENVVRARGVNSSVAGSLGQDCEFPLRLMCGLAHCYRRTGRERERGRIGGTISASYFCKKLCSRAVLALSDYVYNP